MNEPSPILVGVYINRMSKGEKYLFANVSIPSHWRGVRECAAPVDLGHLLNEWYRAYLREQLP